MTSLAQVESALVKQVFWRIRSAESDEQFQMPFGKFLAPLILKLNSSDEAVRSKQDVKLRSLVFVAVGKITRCSSNKLTKDIQALQIFFDYMCQEEGDTQLAVQEALSLMSQAYCNLDDTNRQLLEALLLHNVDKDEPQVLVVTIQHGVTVFSSDHIPSRSILKLGAGDLISGNPSIAKEKCVTTIATLLTDENLSKTSFACLALGENGRKGPLPLLPGSEQFPETEVKHEVDFKDQDITKTWLVRNLVAMFKTSNGSSKMLSSVLKTFIFLTLLCATNGLERFELVDCIDYPGGRFKCKIKQQETTQTTTQTHYNKIIFFLVVIAVAVISGYCLWKRTVQFRREIGARFVNGRGIRHLGIADIDADALFILESSKSIPCCHYNKMLRLTSLIVFKFPTRESQLRTSSIIFSSETHLMSPFNGDLTRDEAVSDILQFNHLQQGSQTDRALQFIINEDLFSEEKGARRNSVKIMFLITYLLPDPLTSCKRIAATIRSQRINIICVGIGEQVNLLGELTEIAGSDKNVFISRTFDTLPYLDDEILARVYALCLEGKNAN